MRDVRRWLLLFVDDQVIGQRRPQRIDHHDHEQAAERSIGGQ